LLDDGGTHCLGHDWEPSNVWEESKKAVLFSKNPFLGLYQGLLTMTCHREPPFGGVAIQAASTVLAAWIASSPTLLAMTGRSGPEHRDSVLRRRLGAQSAH
jgi:hypothetical protein